MDIIIKIKSPKMIHKKIVLNLIMDLVKIVEVSRMLSSFSLKAKMLGKVLLTRKQLTLAKLRRLQN